MISPHKEPSTVPTSIPNASPRTSTSTAIPLNGLLINGSWRCNCPQRPPAMKFQTRNNGVNHGRWFWTCQKPHSHNNQSLSQNQNQNQSQKCNFFLWASDVEVREKNVVLSNSRSESFGGSGDADVDAGPTTPSKGSRMSFGDGGYNGNGNGNGNGLLTPQTGRKIRDFFTPVSATRSARVKMMEEDMPSSFGDKGEIGVTGQVSFQNRLRQVQSAGADESESPRKAPRTATMTSPGKRKISGLDDGRGFQTQRPLFEPQFSPMQTLSPSHGLNSDSPSLSWTPNRIPPSSAELCMTPTPMKYRNVLTASPASSPSQQARQPSDLANQAISLLESQSVVIPRSTQEDLVSLLNRFDLRMKGVSRGRDISREVMKEKDEEILKLNERVKNLERQREMDGAVIGGL